jgi:NAD(P)-dependent dehydrogenase (short-subunit alcohol dehydrogenase family)
MRIVVTGSSTGIGRGLVLRLTAEGHSVWGIARSDQSEFEKAQHGAFRSTQCDVADWANMAKAAETVGMEWPRLDALVCCAGSQGEVGPAVRANPERWSAIFTR